MDSNSKKVLASIPEHLRLQKISDIRIDCDTVVTVLGLSWTPANEELIFILNFEKMAMDISEGVKVPAKREVLRIVMYVYNTIFWHQFSLKNIFSCRIYGGVTPTGISG